MQAQQITLDVMLEKYAKGGETTQEQIFERVSKALAEINPGHEANFMKALSDGFIPGGRIMSAAGTGLKATLINCFVQPVGDSVSEDENGKVGIYTALLQAAETMRRGGGVGYNFSRIRPSGAKVKGTNSRASGPLSYMHVFDSSCKTVESAGARRGAQMGILNCDHPDFLDFIHAKDQGDLRNFNLSVGVFDEFMQAVEAGADWELVHEVEPDREINPDAYQRADGKWVYRKINAAEVWGEIMHATYDHAEPGVIFLSQVNRDNNLSYVEVIEASNPCGEQFLPDYGCCCLGSIDLTRFVNMEEPFVKGSINYPALAENVTVAVRALDSVLDLTVWPLKEQDKESKDKRRIGLGFTGLGDALIMLGIAYNSQAGRDLAAKVSEFIRDAAYRASVDLAIEKGPFPLFDADQYLAEPRFASRLPQDIKKLIRKHGIRNSHLLSIAPTGTISLAFADNASNGIEPAFSWFYNRKKINAEGGHDIYVVEDHAYRLYREMGGDVKNLPPAFVSALEMSAHDHMLMVAAVRPYIDAAISKTVNVPADYPFEDFKGLYVQAWKHGLKGITTYRPNSILGSVISVDDPKAQPSDIAADDPDRRIVLKETPAPTLASLKWPGRPKLKGGNPCWTYMVENEGGKFAVFVGHMENGRAHPFECWVNGDEPRALGAVAKTLSMDMRSQDRAWLLMKLDALANTRGDKSYTLELGGSHPVVLSSASAVLATLVKERVQQLGALEPEKGETTPVVDALFSRKEPKTGTDGTMTWAVDILNPATGDDFVLMLKELVLPNGQRRPYSMWLTGHYPHELDGLCKLISIDMRVIDAAWIGMKLRKLLNYAEPQGDFFARLPGSEKSQCWPSTEAYIARLMIHRYAMLGILTEEGYPVENMGVMVREEQEMGTSDTTVPRAMAGKQCPECGNHTVIKKDGCDYCTSCGHIGSCG